jgi:hypothetical protein
MKIAPAARKIGLNPSTAKYLIKKYRMQLKMGGKKS